MPHRKKPSRLSAAEAKTVLQRAQRVAYAAMNETYETIRREKPDLPFDEAYLDPRFQQYRKAYEKTILALQKQLGPHASCADVDCDLWNLFAAWYQRTHDHAPDAADFTREKVIAFLVRH